jgi:hypothetical protein
MPVRQALNAVYAQVVSHMDGKERKSFVDELYGFGDLNKRGNDVLRDFRAADQAMTSGGGE